jgi:predicted kinase
MEKQLNSKLTLVLMAGLAGSGKTTLAKALGRKLGWPVLSKDKYMTWLLNMHPGMTNDDAGWDAFELVLNEAEEFLALQRFSLILDSAVRRPFIVKRAINIARSAEADLKIILCTSTSQIRETRLNERIASGEHLPFMGNKKLLEIEDENEHFKHLPLDKWVIDTHLLSPEACLTSALQYLGYPDRFGKV